MWKYIIIIFKFASKKAKQTFRVMKTAQWQTEIMLFPADQQLSWSWLVEPVKKYLWGYEFNLPPVNGL